MFSLRFDFQGGGEDDNGDFVSDPPSMVIVCPDGFDIGGRYFEAIPTVECPQWEDDHWKMPDEALQILRAINRQ